MANAAAPTPDESELIAFLNSVDQEVRAWGRDTKFEDRSGTWEKLRSGEFWRGTREDAEPIFNANLLGNYIERKVAQLTESKPDISVTGRAPDLQGPSEILLRGARAVLDENPGSEP